MPVSFPERVFRAGVDPVPGRVDCSGDWARMLLRPPSPRLPTGQRRDLPTLGTLPSAPAPATVDHSR
jgi:hypothetical protein